MGTNALKILVAEDSPTQAAYLKMALKRGGHKVLMAKDGIEAVECAYREAPDLLVSDIVMPRLNGYQVCRLLKDDDTMRDMPIILLTSLDEQADRFWGMKSGADRYLTKTADIPQLVDDIEEFIKEQGLKPRADKGAGEEESRATQDIAGRVIQLLDKSLFESTVLNDIGELVNKLEDYKKIMLGVLELLSKFVGFDLGVIVLLNEEAMECFLYINAPVDDDLIEGARSRVEEMLLDETRGERLPPLGLREVYDPGRNRKAPGELRGAEIRSYYTRPLTTKSVPNGAIGLFSQKEGTFSERVMHALTIISQQANIVIDYARLYERNKQLSITDGLTKVYNHRFFQENLIREFARSQRHKSSLALVMLDIDHFKQFNDTYGHQQGDSVLAELARLLKRLVRNLDTVSRYGGEEFAITMPDADLEDATRVADRLRMAVAEHEFPGNEKPLQVTVSMGVAAIPHPLLCNTAQMISAADRALYQAKKKGRNRVEQAT